MRPNQTSFFKKNKTVQAGKNRKEQQRQQPQMPSRFIDLSSKLNADIESGAEGGGHGGNFELSWLVGRRLQVADAAAGQSGFIAGFAYYELSRQSAANAERVPLYPILRPGADAVSIC